MGRDKALLPCRGATLAGHLASLVARAAGSAALVGSPDLYARLGFPVLADLYPGQGPLGGVLTALAASPADLNLVVACDMPSLAVRFLEGLLAAAEHSRADCLVPLSRKSGTGTSVPGTREVAGHPRSGSRGQRCLSSDFQVEPLCAVYRASARPRLERLFLSGARAITGALRSLGTEYHEIGEAEWFENLNTPGQWEAHLGLTGASWNDD